MAMKYQQTNKKVLHELDN